MPSNGEQYDISRSAVDLLKEIEDDTSLEWKRVAREDTDNNLEQCTNYDKGRLLLLEEELIKMAKDECDIVRTDQSPRPGSSNMVAVS
jgi:alkylated DNA nucleotide flippase Atl1